MPLMCERINKKLQREGTGVSQEMKDLKLIGRLSPFPLFSEVTHSI